MKCIDQVSLKNKRILLRVDFNVSLNKNYTIANDERIKQSLPTIEYLLRNNNKLIIVSHLDRPKGRDKKLSLKGVAEKLHSYLPSYNVSLIPDFLTDSGDGFAKQNGNEIIMLENIRFYPEEKQDDPAFAKKLASLAD